MNGTYIVQQATIPLDYSQIETLTLVPMGTPLDQLNGLDGQPSIAAFAPTTPLWSTGGSYSYDASVGTYVFTSGGSSSSVGSGTGGLTGLTNLNILFAGAGIWRPARNVANLFNLPNFGWTRLLDGGDDE